MKNFKNVKRCNIRGRIYYKAYVTIKGERFEKNFTEEKEAAKYVDLICIKKNIPQKNNTFKKAKNG